MTQEQLATDLSEMSKEIPDLEPPLHVEVEGHDGEMEESDPPYSSPVHDHWALFEKAKKRFEQIFPMGKLSYMLGLLNFMRLDASVWSDISFDTTYSGFVVHPENSAKFHEVVELSEKVSAFYYKGKMVPAEDEAERALWDKTFHDMCMLMYRHKRIHKKANRSVPLSLLTPGTVIEFHVKHGSYKEPTVVTVDHLAGCDMHHGLVISQETRMREGNWHWGNPFPFSEPHTFNTSHITKVIKHAPGKIVVKGNPSDQSCEYQYSKHDAIPKIGKSKNTYNTHRGNTFIIAAEIERLGILQDTTQALDYERFARWMNVTCPGLKMSDRDEDTWYPSTLSVRKKKLRRFVRQNMNRMLLSMKEQIRREEEYNKRMDREMEMPFDDGE